MVQSTVVSEGQSATEENEWPGGAKQIFRESGCPLPTTLLREVRAPTKNLDELNAQRSLADVQALVLRNIDSWSFNLLAPNAKQKAQQVIFDKGYDETYNLMVFSVRGEKCAAIKAYPYDWQLFAFREDNGYPKRCDK